jgi:RND family efflux transporter MFP subunit
MIRDADQMTPEPPPGFDLPSLMDIPRPPRRRGRRAAILVVVAAAALLAVTVALARLRAAAPVLDRSGVLIATVERGPMLRAVQGQGTLVPEDIRFLSAVAGGRVERVRVRPGARVAADTVLVDIANPDVELAALEAARQVATAAADLTNLRARLENERLGQEAVVAGTHSELAEAERRALADGELAKRGFLSELEMARSRDQAKTLDGKLGIEQQRLGAQTRGFAAQLRAQEEQLLRLRAIADFRKQAVDALHVRASVAGVLQELPLQPGQTVAPGALVAKVADPTRLRAEVRVPETQAREVRVGQPARIDTRNGVVAGAVSRVEPAVQAGTVRVEVTASEPWPEGARPDLTVDGTIELERIADTVFVDRPALAEAQATVQLWKVVGDEAVRTTVTLGRASVRTVEIRRGLQPGEQVIVSDMSAWDKDERVRLR